MLLEKEQRSGILFWTNTWKEAGRRSAENKPPSALNAASMKLCLVLVFFCLSLVSLTFSQFYSARETFSSTNKQILEANQAVRYVLAESFIVSRIVILFFSFLLKQLYIYIFIYDMYVFAHNLAIRSIANKSMYY